MRKYAFIALAAVTVGCGAGSPTAPSTPPVVTPAPVAACQANQTGILTLKNASTQGLYISIDGVARGSLPPGGTSAPNTLPGGSHAVRFENHLGYQEWLCSTTVMLNACDDK